jgi:choline dehydrogenase
MHTLSRGTVNLNISDPYDGEPIVDYRSLSNPVDSLINLALFNAIRKYFNLQGEIQKLKPVEVSPGVNITGEELVKWLDEKVNPSAFHPVGTCAMMPLELGGVVDGNLKVHGIDGLSIVDGSVMPMVPAATTQSTVYAVAEKVCTVVLLRIVS